MRRRQLVEQLGGFLTLAPRLFDVVRERVPVEWMVISLSKPAAARSVWRVFVTKAYGAEKDQVLGADHVYRTGGLIYTAYERESVDRVLLQQREGVLKVLLRTYVAILHTHHDVPPLVVVLRNVARHLQRRLTLGVAFFGQTGKFF